MGILDAITHSSAKTGIRMVVAGVEGVGKTTLGCQAPRPLLIPLETGYAGVKINKVPMLEHFEHVMMLLDEIIVQSQQRDANGNSLFVYQSLVFDSATSLERLIHQAVLETDPTYAVGNKKAITMESALGGFGKAYTHANNLFGNFLTKCDWLATNAGVNIILTCHVFAAKVIDPTVGEYDTWDILLHSPKNQKTYGKREMLTQWADVLGFLHEPLYITEAAKGKTMNRGISADQGRVLAINRTPGYVAKNRFHVVNNMTIPREGCGWNVLANEIYQASGFDCWNRDAV